MRRLSAVVLFAAAVASSAVWIGSASARRATAEGLPASVQKRIAAQARRTARFLSDPTVATATVFGPSSRVALVRAASGDLVRETARQRRERFYLIVLRGHFVCRTCSAPPGGKLPRGRIATLVWTPSQGVTDLGVSNRLRPSISHLGTPTILNLHR